MDYSFSDIVPWLNLALLICFGAVAIAFRKYVEDTVSLRIRSKFDKEFETFRRRMEDRAAREITALQSGISAQTIGAERRIEAISQLWDKVLKYRSYKPMPFAETLFCTQDEYIDMHFNTEETFGGGSEQERAFATFVKENDIEELRPFFVD